jgi:hypothetical protein
MKKNSVINVDILNLLRMNKGEFVSVTRLTKRKLYDRRENNYGAPVCIACKKEIESGYNVFDKEAGYYRGVCDECLKTATKEL